MHWRIVWMMSKRLHSTLRLLNALTILFKCQKTVFNFDAIRCTDELPEKLSAIAFNAKIIECIDNCLKISMTAFNAEVVRCIDNYQNLKMLHFLSNAKCCICLRVHWQFFVFFFSWLLSYEIVSYWLIFRLLLNVELQAVD